MKRFKPLLAEPVTNFSALTYPKLASPKLDGIRCGIHDGSALSRSLKPIPNRYIQSILGNPALNHLDGEITCGDANDPDIFNKTTTIVRSRDKVADFTFHVFDYFANPGEPFHERLEQATRIVLANRNLPIKIVLHYPVRSEVELRAYEETMLTEGFEGIMLRSLHGPYKYGRSTEKEQILLKVKRFVDAEAVVIGFEELMHNDNEATIDELGHTKRSSHQENKTAAGTLGALIVRDCETGMEFNIGTGFTALQRQDIWDRRKLILGDIVTYKYFPHGVKDAPRHPVFKGWRAIIDL